MSEGTDHLKYRERTAVGDSVLVVIRHLLELVEDALETGRVTSVFLFALLSFLLLADVTAADVETVTLVEQFQYLLADLLDRVSSLVTGLTHAVQDYHTLVTLVA